MEDKEAVLTQVQGAVQRGTHLDLQIHPIAMELDKGVLTLEGEVPSLKCKKLALAAAGAVAGVTGIADRLRVTPAERLGDGAVRDSVCEQLLRDVDFLNCCLQVRVKGKPETLRVASGDLSGSMEVAVEDGVITLTGQVISLSHKRLAGALAWWARGCRDVVNGLEVVPPEDDNDDELTDALRLVLETDPLVPAEQIAIHTHNYAVALDGVVATEEEKHRAEFDAWCVFAVDRVINRLEVRP